MKRITFTLSGLLCCLFLLSFTGPGKRYIKKIEKHRKKVHKEFADPETSPLKEAATDFTGLDYFPVNPEYRVKAIFRRTSDAKPFMIPTSNPDRQKEYVKYGILSFELNGQQLELSVYKSLRLAAIPEYKDHLFLPFKDHTNGLSTYGGGRYMDLTIPRGKKMVLDFNLCYNPYCAYGDGWSCPIPPEENHLEFAIEAGVKKFEDPH